MNDQHIAIIHGREMGARVSSRILEEQIQKVVASGFRQLNVKAFGQHGIGGRLWSDDKRPIQATVEGPAGQRLGSMGFPGTRIEVKGPASDDVGWLNAGAEIVIHGNAGNGVANAMAQGKVQVGGNIGARGMTMTKYNPRFTNPELWVLGSVGDYFGEFMAGGIAVICGVDSQNPDNVLGHRPFVGMVGGRAFFRGPYKGYSQTDAKLVTITDDDWDWLTANLKQFLEAVKKPELFETIAEREQWQVIAARTPQEKISSKRRSMETFHRDVWEAELGQGGLIGDLMEIDRSPIPLIPTGDLRRAVPRWENGEYLAPCEATCPSGIPVRQRWQLIRDGLVDEAVDLALQYSPFPATVCGYLCPNPCMDACTRQSALIAPVDTAVIGKASIDARTPDLPVLSGHKIAIIGGGPAGISTAWQLRLKGHAATIFDLSETLGGKIPTVIPESRSPAEVVDSELDRVREVIAHEQLKEALTSQDVRKLADEYEYVVIATGAWKPRTLPVPGAERMVPALDFLAKARTNMASVGKKVVVIGAGNVGCDVATEAHRLGAEDILLIDVQQPASFGTEREEAEKIGAQFKWPCFTKEITADGVVLTTGELLPADSVFISIGDAPDLGFLPPEVTTAHGYIQTDAVGRTADPTIFAIGDAVRPGLLTDAIGSGRRAAEAIDSLLDQREPADPMSEVIDINRVSLEYFDPRISGYDDVGQCGDNCASCGTCRDCGICVAVCPQAAISRMDSGAAGYEYAVDASTCIGCGFCAGACPCGVWNMVPNTAEI